MHSKTEAIENDLLKLIESGAFRNHYLIYNRKSTDEPNNQKNSIKYQRAENMRFAVSFHLPIAPITLKGFSLDGVISEKHSGFKEDAALRFGDNGTVEYRIDRPKFYRLVQLLNKKYFKGVIVLCWDRVSRNKGDNTIIEKLMKQGVDFRFALATYDKTSSGALHKDIDGMFAEHHSRVTSEKVSLNIKNHRSRGICTYKAPVGYLNPGSMENKPFDPIRAPLIRKIFTLCATGQYSLADLARWANTHGLTMPPVRRRRTDEEILAEEEDEVSLHITPVERPITYNNIHKILTNPFYTGKVLGVGKVYVPSKSHIALISEKEFKEVQAVLSHKKVSKHYTQKLKLLYRGILRCEVCSRSYTPYEKKGILYFGARCAENCTNPHRNINKLFLENRIGELLHNLKLTDKELQELEIRKTAEIAAFDSRQEQLDMLERQKRKINEDLNYLNDNRLVLLRTGVYTPETYLAEEIKYNTKLAELLAAEQNLDAAISDVINNTIKLSELVKDLCFYYERASSIEKEDITKSIISELSFSENGLKIKCKNGLQLLESRFYFLGDPTTWISELVKSHNRITESIEVATKIIAQVG